VSNKPVDTSQFAIDLNAAIAIVGVGCILPGGNNLEQLWQSIEDKKSFVKEITDPESIISPIYNSDSKSWNTANTRLAARVDAFEFPYERFRKIPPSVIKSMDMWAQMALVAAQNAIDQARSCLNDDSVFVSVANSGFDNLIHHDLIDGSLYLRLAHLKNTETFKQLPIHVQNEIIKQLETDYFKLQEPLSVEKLIHSATTIVGARIAKFNGFAAGHTAVDSACASSFAAMDIAIRKLRAGEINSAVVGAVGRLSPFLYVYCSKAQTMSTSGSFPFDQRASGFVAGEGVGFVALKRLEDAVASNAKIIAVIRGIGGSSDGSETGPWAPNKEGQKLALTRALKQTGYSLSTVQYVECHGTGTQVGDVEELTGLQEMLEPLQTQNQSIAVGSAKASTGHLLTGAGMSGLCRTLASLHQHKFPPTALVQNPISFFSKENCKVYLPTKAMPWPRPALHPRRAMVNCFGFGGVNYNMQIEEYDEQYHRNYLQEKNKSTEFKRTKKLSQISLQSLSSTYNVPIAIVGVGLDLPGAKNLQELHQVLLGGQSQIGDISRDRWDMDLLDSPLSHAKWKVPSAGLYKGACLPAPTMKDKLGWKIPPIVLDHLDPNQFRLFHCVDRALRAAGLREDKEILRDTMMMTGLMNDSDFMMREQTSHRVHYLRDFIARKIKAVDVPTREKMSQEYLQSISLELSTFNKDNSTAGVDSMLGSRIAKFYDMKGGAFAVDALCTSAAVILEHALHALRSGEMKAVVACSSNMAMSGPIVSMYSHMGLLSPDGLVRPFDTQANGSVLGEGAVAIVLMRLEDAIARGAKIEAVLHSVSMSADAKTPQMLAPVTDCMKKSISKALQTIDQQKIDSVECQGLGVAKSDEIEVQSILDVYSDRQQSQLPISSHKSYFGQLRVTSGFVSLAKQIVSSQNRQIYKTPFVTDPRQLSAQNHSESQSLQSAVTVETAEIMSTNPILAVSTFGVGGLSGHMLLSQFDKSMYAQSNESSSRVSEGYKNSAVYDVNQQDKSIQYFTVAGNQFATLGSVVDSRLWVEKNIKTITSPMISLMQKRDIYFVNKDLLNKPLALVFCGQSSAYAKMYLSMIETVPLFRQYLDIADAKAIHWGKTKFSEIVYSDDEQSAAYSDLFYSNFLSFIFQCAYAKYLIEDLGIRPSLLIGHSLGEFTAAVVSGVYSFENGLDILFHRYQCLKDLNSNGRLAVIRDSEKSVTHLIKNIPGVYIANCNTDQQTVIGGLLEDINKAKEILLEKNIELKILNASHAYHTPIVASASDPLYEKIKNIPTGKMMIPMTSFGLNEIVTDSSAVARILADGYSAQVHFSKVISLAEEFGIRHYVDVGPSWVSYKMVEANLESMNKNLSSKAYYLNHAKEDDKKSLSNFVMQQKIYFPKEIQSTTQPYISGDEQKRAHDLSKLFFKNKLDYSWFQQRMPQDFNQWAEKALDNLKKNLPVRYEKELFYLAQESGMEFEELIRFSGLSSALTMKYGLCSGFVLTRQNMHGANYDLPFVSAQDSDKFPRQVLEFAVPGFQSFIGVFKAGSILPVSGMNRAGLSVSFAAASAPKELATGVSAPLLARRILEECVDLKQVRLLIKSLSFESQFLLMVSSYSQQDGFQYSQWEISSKAVCEISDRVYANHFEHLYNNSDVAEDSVIRRQRLQQLLRDHQENPVLEGKDSVPNASLNVVKNAASVTDSFVTAQNILGDGFDIARNKNTTFATKNTVNRFNTGISVVFSPRTLELSISLGKIPSGNGPYTFHRFTPMQSEEKKTIRWTHQTTSLFDLKELLNKQQVENTRQIYLLYNIHSEKQSRLAEKVYEEFYHFSSVNADPASLNRQLSLIQLIPLDFNKEKDFLNDNMFINNSSCQQHIVLDITAWVDLFSLDECSLFLKKAALFQKHYSGFSWLHLVADSANDNLSLMGSSDIGFYRTLAHENNGSICTLFAESCTPSTIVEKTILNLVSLNNLSDLPVELKIYGANLYKKQWVPSRSQQLKDASNVILKTHLVTGGASGITLEIVKRLAETTVSGNVKTKFILVGRSDPEDYQQYNSREEFLLYIRAKVPGQKPAYYMSMWEKNEKLATLKQSLQELDALKVNYKYVIANLSTTEGLLSLKEKIKNENVDCLIHGAGIQRSKLMRDKSIAEFSQIYMSKTLDTWQLLQMLRDHPLKKIIAFSSIAAVNGNSGQADYSATNSVTLALGQFVKNHFPTASYKAIAWPAWGEVGMATDKAVQQAMIDKGMDFISVKSGVDFFINEYLSADSDPVICTSSKKDFVTDSKVYLQYESAIATSQLQSACDRPYVDHFWLENSSADDTNYYFNKTFTGHEEFLLDHIIRGVPTIPGVVLLEMICQSSSIIEKQLSLRLNQVKEIKFRNSATVEKPTCFRIHFSPCPIQEVVQDLNQTKHESKNNKVFNFTISSPKQHPAGYCLLYDNIHCQGQVSFSNETLRETDEAVSNIESILSKSSVLKNKTEFFNYFRSVFTEHIGPSFETLETVLQAGKNNILSKVVLPASHNAFGIGRFTLHPAVMDMLNQTMVEFETERSSQNKLDKLFIPFSYHNIEIFKSVASAGCYYILNSDISVNAGEQSDEMQFVVQVFNENKELCLRMSKAIHRSYIKNKLKDLHESK